MPIALVLFAALTWIGHPDSAAPVESTATRFCRYRNEFEGQGKLTLSVTADERYILFLDGRRIDRGPDRSDPAHWSTRTLSIDPGPGSHRLEAVVWQVGEHAPYAQMSAGRGAFALSVEPPYDRVLSTGAPGWKVGRLTGLSYVSCGGWGACAFGNMFVDASAGFTVSEPDAWLAPVVVEALRLDPNRDFGKRSDLWEVVPSRLPQQVDRRIAPGAFVAVISDYDTNNLWTAADAAHPHLAAFNALWREGRALLLAPGERLRALLDLGGYFCGYPELAVRGGKGGEIRVGWSEALKDAAGLKGDRGAWQGKGEYRFADRFRPQGGDAFYTTPWWRCGRWVTLEARAGAEPLELTSLHLAETRYPLADEGSFSCDDPSLGEIRRLCRRGLEMCAHEMTFDCPYYEQQMYPGDSRVQLLTLAALTADDRLPKRVMELFDWSRESDGFARFNYPSRHRQLGATYTLCHLLMFGDFVRWHRDDAFLRARLLALRHELAAFECLENAEGLVSGLPGWSFVDWVDRWPRGVAPDADSRTRPSSIVNLFYALALRSVASVEELVGDRERARAARTRADRVVASVRARFLDARRGLVADDLDHREWSEHAQVLAVLADLYSADEAARVLEELVRRPLPATCSVYFLDYLFEAAFKLGRGDIFLRRLDLWREYLKLGLSTPLERPNVRNKSGKVVSESRSDCHAWGSHPLYFMTTGLAGIRPDAPGFRRVRIAPAPGDLKRIAARSPHPDGEIAVELSFADGGARGRVVLPPGLTGTFVWQGRACALKPGENVIGENP